MKVWKHTRVDLSLNPYQHISPDGSTQTTDLGFTESLMRYCRQSLGSQCGLAPGSLTWPPAHPKQLLYEYMTKLGPPLVFQTEAPVRLTDWQATLQLGIQIGAGCIEMAPAGARGYLQDPVTLLQRYSEELAANPGP